MNKKIFYITTPIYYVNDKPHIGHAYTTIAADVMARFQKEQNREVFFLTGTDEHGLKIQKEAEELGEKPQEFVDGIAGQFKKLWQELDIEYSRFIRTTDDAHKKTVQIVLQNLFDKGVIYKGAYEGLYCVGCEQFKNEADLVDGKCLDHDVEPEKVKEECYLLKMGGEIQKKLIEKIKNDQFKIKPERYKKEILSFLESQELKDLSISRKNVSWGIPLPFDNEHTTYVWVDALLNYLTGLGWDGDSQNIPQKWPPEVQLIGKDILRVHATIWPVLLMHLGIEFPQQLFVHGHILSEGKKMSKTLGNVIGIDEMIEKFGVDGTRYLLLSAGTFGDDIDVTMERMIEKYNADLANGLGNLVSRVVKLSEDFKDIDTAKILEKINQKGNHLYGIKENFILWMDKRGVDMALNKIWKDIIQKSNKRIENSKPWELKKNNKDEFDKIMKRLVEDIFLVSDLIYSFMPETSERIKKALETKKTEILFERAK
jgi:methionyl-tRNA synthetase